MKIQKILSYSINGFSAYHITFSVALEHVVHKRTSQSQGLRYANQYAKSHLLYLCELYPV